METPFTAYTGDQPYVFVCYAHDDSEVVYPEMTWLRDQGVNLWYDEGISAGKNWRTAIGDSLLNASHVLFYISAASLRSDHCNREINLALDEGKEVVPVYIEDVELTTDLKVGLNRVQALHRDKSSTYAQHLLNSLGTSRPTVSPHPYPSERTSWRVYALSAFVVVMVLGVGWFYRQIGSSSVVENELNPTTSPPLTAIAVLPFDDLSPNGDQRWLADGIAVELTESLGRIEGLHVPGVKPVATLYAQKSSLVEIGERLGVGTVLEGSIRRSGDRINVIAQWTYIRDGVRLWSASYDRTLDDVFAIQKEIAVGISEAIRTELGIRDTTAFLFKQRYKTSDVRAWELLRKATALSDTFEPTKMSEARTLLERAIDIDPSYAEAYAQLASLEQGDQAQRVNAAQLALKLDPTNASALGILVWDSSMANWDYETAERLLEVGMNANSQANNLMEFAWYVYFNTGQLEKALEVAKRATRIDPLDARAHCRVGWSHYNKGDDKAAVGPFEMAFLVVRETNQGLVWCAPELANIYRANGRESEMLETAVLLFPDYESGMKRGWEVAGWEGMWLELADAWGQPTQQVGGNPKMARCGWLAMANAKQAMYECLDERIQRTGAYGSGAYYAETIERLMLARYVVGERMFNPYRQEARFQELLRRVKERIDNAAGSYQ